MTPAPKRLIGRPPGALCPPAVVYLERDAADLARACYGLTLAEVCRRLHAEKRAAIAQLLIARGWPGSDVSRVLGLACFSKKGNEWQKNNPVQAARQKRNHHLLKRFGITKAEEDRLLAEQGGVCAICTGSISDKRGYGPHIDHDHETGEVRGILCIRCNNGLGLFKDNIELLRAAADYLERIQTTCGPLALCNPGQV